VFDMHPFYGGWSDGMDGFSIFFGLLIALIFLIGIGVFIWWMGRQTSVSKQVPPTRQAPQIPVQRSRALELLDERYAKGEIGKEEYQERRETLSQ
jgi:putative membrane protein